QATNQTGPRDQARGGNTAEVPQANQVNAPHDTTSGTPGHDQVLSPQGNQTTVHETPVDQTVSHVDTSTPHQETPAQHQEPPPPQHQEAPPQHDNATGEQSNAQSSTAQSTNPKQSSTQTET